MSSVEVTQRIRAGDLLYIAEHMRRVDRAEVWAMSRRGPVAALIHSASVTEEPWMAMADGVPAALFGVYKPVLGTEGTPWFLGTDVVTAQSKDMLRMSRRFIAHALTTCTTLRNYVHSENAPALRYLRHLGFKIGPLQEIQGGAFVHEFVKERPAHV